MIKIPSSYNKLIKNKYVADKNREKKVLDVDYNILPKKRDYIVDVDLEEEGDGLGRPPYDLKDIRKEIEKAVVKEIEDERRKILKIAKEQGDSIREKASEIGYDDGYGLALEKGYVEGMERARQETQEAKDHALDMIVQAEKMTSDYFVENEKRIINLAVNMAESIVGFSIDEDSDGILNLVKPVIAEYSKKEKITISCHGDRYDFLKRKLYELEEISPDTKFFVFRDNNLELNDCIIESEDQVIDLSIKRQLDSIVNTIKHME